MHEWGDPQAPTLVCLHGITAFGGRYARLARERLARAWHVVAPDLRGHGLSTYEPPWSLEQFLDDVLETVPEDARHWVGHSFGGRLLLELAHRRPDRVERGVLLDPALWVPPSYALEQAEAARFDRSFASVEEAVSMRLVDGTVHRATRELLEEDFAAHLAVGEDGRLRPRFSRSCVIALWSEMSRTPPQQRLEVPLLVARAVDAAVCPPVLVEAYAATVGELLQTTELPGGHIVFWDALQETGDAIEGFLGHTPAL